MLRFDSSLLWLPVSSLAPASVSVPFSASIFALCFREQDQVSGLISLHLEVTDLVKFLARGSRPFRRIKMLDFFWLLLCSLVCFSVTHTSYSIKCA
jgi:hypothetical protein